MNFHYTVHARDQMARRGVSEEDVMVAMSNITIVTVSTRRNSTWVYGMVPANRVLKVCVSGASWPQSDTLTVITAAWKDSDD